TPSNMLVSLSSRKFKTVKTNSKLYKRGKSISISLPLNEYNFNIIKRGFMPNFIHSMDAANIHLLINLILSDKDLSLYTIHDCFASTPNNMGKINKFVRNTFIKLYFDKNYLNIMHNNFIEQIKCHYTVYDNDNIKYFYIDDELVIIPNLPSSP
ncbi:hypothetical protein BJ085DRAFT_20939, partial [Dimargaris cristalligena]